MSFLGWLLKVPGLVWLIAGAVVGGGLWLREHDKRLKAEVRVETLKTVNDSLARVITRAEHDLQQKELMAAAQRQEDEKRIQQATEIGRVAQAKAKDLAIRLRQQIADSTRPTFDSLQAEYATQLVSKDSLFAAEHRLRLLAEEQVVDRDKLLATYRTLNKNLEQAVALNAARAHRSLWENIVDKAPWVVGALIVGRVTK